MKDRKKDWGDESAPTDRALTPFVAVREDRGLSITSQNGQTYRISGKQISTVQQSSITGSQSGQVNVEAEVQIMVIHKRKPDITCLRFGMKDKSIQFHTNSLERTVTDTAAINEISDALEHAMLALLKADVNKGGEQGRVRRILPQALADESRSMLIWGIDRYDVPVWTALVKIGRPAVPSMIENIQQMAREISDKKSLRKKSLDVLCHVLGGKRRLLQLLSKLQKKATDKEKHRRITVAQQFPPNNSSIVNRGPLLVDNLPHRYQEIFF